eukprot:5853686-Pleurochrysis_carterae.AAC.1
MPSCSILLCFACTFAVLARCIACVLELGALSPESALWGFPVSERMADLAVTCASPPETTSGAPSPRARVLPCPYL